MIETVTGVCGKCSHPYPKYTGTRRSVEGGDFLDVEKISPCPKCGWVRETSGEESICVAEKED